jgi:hypothetical protein
VNIPRESALRGLHNRHHVGKGKVVPTCTFCQLPNVKAGGKQLSAEVIAAETASTIAAAKDFADKLLKDEVDRSLFHDRAWSCALSGMSVDEAAKALGMQLPMFMGMAEDDFKKPWKEVREQARLQVRRDITVSAINEAKGGNSRLLGKLLEEHFFDSWLVDERKAKENATEITTEELDARLEALYSKRGFVNRWKERFQQPDSTVTMRDASAEEVASVLHPHQVKSEYVSDVLTHDSARQNESTKKVAVNNETPPTVTQETTPPEVVEAVVEEALGGPVVFTPEQGLPLFATGNDRRRS